MRTHKNSRISLHHHHHLHKIKNLKMIKIRKKIKRKTMTRRMNSKSSKYLMSLSLMPKVGSWMKSFSFLRNKHKDIEVKLGEQRMLSFQKIGADISSLCFQSTCRVL
ncbi:hypothetical protein B296_00059143 [Ensete ventricosum]|uniref:Uncharacterized protein n=1 Tax=Ensete ventricosum TaxID=4639 RepID=A0A426XIX4_ENSVE|nr:hypothetical protein B296_00059143 [Ensete ventricosum]